MKQDDKSPLSDWLLERLALGELDAATAADVRQRLAAEGRTLDDVIARVAASNQEIMEQHPPATTVAAIRRRAAAAIASAQPARRRVFVWGAPLALAAAAAAALMIARPWRSGAVTTTDVPTEALEYIGVKGELALHVYRHGAAGDERLRDGARATRGDLLQLAYASKTGGYGVLLSIDGARKVTLHLPEADAGKAAQLRDGRVVQVPSAYQLDDAPGFERFFFVTAAEPFDVVPIVAAARTLAERGTARRAPLPLAARFEQVSLVLDKTPPAKKDTR
jgi:hypothetical protein